MGVRLWVVRKKRQHLSKISYYNLIYVFFLQKVETFIQRKRISLISNSLEVGRCAQLLTKF